MVIRMKANHASVLVGTAALVGFVAAFAADRQMEKSPTEEATMTESPTELASFGAGCFWCTEAVFEQVEGVVSVRSGYQGGELKKPSYKQVCTGDTGHAEVVQVEYDPSRVGYDKLLELFWKMHDPTTLNRQGADVGTQYRSVIFYHSDAQREAAERSLKAMNASGAFASPIVTQIEPAPEFYEAEAYHQDYYRKNPHAPYSRYISSKLKKLDMK